jgi:hypothetical protein
MEHNKIVTDEEKKKVFKVLTQGGSTSSVEETVTGSGDKKI